MQYEIKRAGTTVATVHPDGKQTKKIMDVNLVDMTFTLSSSVEFMIGDYVQVYGERYVLQELPGYKKVSNHEHQYTLQFKGRSYELSKIAYLDYDGNNQLTQADFSLMGNADTFIDLLVLNANRIGSGWVKGTVDATKFQNLPFSNQNCMQVLATMASTYDTEWWIDGQTIHMTKQGLVENISYEYGKGKGLYDIERTTQTDKAIYTRLYAYGSDSNIPADYKGYSKRLMLPGSVPYLEANTDKYGIIEYVQIYDDIKPERICTVTSVTDQYNFVDNTMDFDVNNQLLAGVTAKVVFNTGQLAGYQFELASYDSVNKSFRINQNQDEKSLVLPSDLLKPAVGDEFVLVDLNMPQSYITDAEQKVQVKAASDLADNSNPWVVYSVTCDPLNFKKRDLTLTLGNYVRVRDMDMKLDADIRITQFTRDLQEKYTYTMDLQEVVSIPSVVSQRVTYNSLKAAVSLNKLLDVNRARLNWLNTQELRTMVFDPDGYFDGTRIKPLSIETEMLSVGAKSQQFALNGVLMSPNYGGVASQFAWSDGQLVHFTIADQPVTWDIAAGLLTGLTDTNSYYIYAKCDKSSSAGLLVLSTDVIKPEQVDGFYHFWVGVLHSIVDGVRGISLTYGQTNINGRFITTGMIQSADGETYFDLDAGEIGGKIVFKSGSSVPYSSITGAPSLANYVDKDFVIGVQKSLQSQIDGEITTWFYDYEPTLGNAPVTGWSTDADKDTHLGDLFYWQSKGYAYRFQKTADGTLYYWQQLSDTDITTALNNAKTAQDTADSKRRTFINVPFAPYDAGDLWTNGNDLYRCVNAKGAGAGFDAADWQLATVYDSTKTTIDGGVITSGKIMLGNEGGANAGISGDGTTPDSIRIWAGANFDHRADAPFRVTDNGSVVMTQADVTGTITALSGSVGNWSITNGGIENTSGDAHVLTKITGSGGKIMAGIGTAVFDIDTVILPSGSKGVAYFENTVSNPYGANVALYCKAYGAQSPYGNYAAILEGQVVIRGVHGVDTYATIVINGLPPRNDMNGLSYLVWDYNSGQVYAKS